MTASRPSVEIRFFNPVMISWSMAASIQPPARISTAALAVKVAGARALIVYDNPSTSEESAPQREEQKVVSAGEGITRGETEH